MTMSNAKAASKSAPAIDAEKLWREIDEHRMTRYECDRDFYAPRLAVLRSYYSRRGRYGNGQWSHELEKRGFARSTVNRWIKLHEEGYSRHDEIADRKAAVAAAETYFKSLLTEDKLGEMREYFRKHVLNKRETVQTYFEVIHVVATHQNPAMASIITAAEYDDLQLRLNEYHDLCAELLKLWSSIRPRWVSASLTQPLQIVVSGWF
ncbi:MAG: hypothetical protein LAP86_29935 [Acidobacteriia bacterium]|nr:hypothetical protein [Terriglobia bacterium]